MPYYDFVKGFASLEMVHIGWEVVQHEPTLNKKKPWEMQTFHGRWCKGVTAGGCRNNAGIYGKLSNHFIVINGSVTRESSWDSYELQTA